MQTSCETYVVFVRDFLLNFRHVCFVNNVTYTQIHQSTIDKYNFWSKHIIDDMQLHRLK